MINHNTDFHFVHFRERERERMRERGENERERKKRENGYKYMTCYSQTLALLSMCPN